MKPHHLNITFDVNIAPWRIDDPNDYSNADWSLWVFDRNLGQWVPHTEWKRPGESCKIIQIEVVDE